MRGLGGGMQGKQEFIPETLVFFHRIPPPSPNKYTLGRLLNQQPPAKTDRQPPPGAEAELHLESRGLCRGPGRRGDWGPRSTSGLRVDLGEERPGSSLRPCSISGLLDPGVMPEWPSSRSPLIRLCRQ